MKLNINEVYTQETCITFKFISFLLYPLTLRCTKHGCKLEIINRHVYKKDRNDTSDIVN